MTRLGCRFPCRMATALQKRPQSRPCPEIPVSIRTALQGHKPEMSLMLGPLCMNMSPASPQGSQNTHNCCREGPPVLSHMEQGQPPSAPCTFSAGRGRGVWTSGGRARVNEGGQLFPFGVKRVDFVGGHEPFHTAHPGGLWLGPWCLMAVLFRVRMLKVGGCIYRKDSVNL